MQKKIIFLDIDGTLTEPGVNVPPESALRAIRGAQQNGHKVFLCTGRNYDMMSPLLKYGFDGYIASSGGYVVVGEEVIYDCPMTPEQHKRVMETLETNGVFRTVECLDGSYTDEGFKQFLAENASAEGNSELLRWREQIEKSLNIRPMAEYEGQPIYKVVIMSPGMEPIDASRAPLEEDFAFVIQDTKGAGIVNGEIVNRRFDKGQAVKRVSEYLGIPIEDTIGYGDSMNDLEMIEAVGYSVVMDNGAQALKDIADEVCPAVTEDGLYQSFVARGLCES